MHTLTKLLFGEFGHSHADDTIKKYLRDRAEWLNKNCFKPFSRQENSEFYRTKVIQAFELSPECEKFCSCPRDMGVFAPEDVIRCNRCGKPLPKLEDEKYKPKPALPEKFGEINQHYEFMDLVTKIDQILDYLRSKE